MEKERWGAFFLDVQRDGSQVLEKDIPACKAGKRLI